MLSIKIAPDFYRYVEDAPRFNRFIARGSFALGFTNVACKQRHRIRCIFARESCRDITRPRAYRSYHFQSATINVPDTSRISRASELRPVYLLLRRQRPQQICTSPFLRESAAFQQRILSGGIV